MAVSEKIRWKRMVNEIRFLHNEKALVQEVNKEAAPRFHEHYVKFAARHGLNLSQLNAEHSTRLDKLYGAKQPKILPEDFSDFEDSPIGALVPYAGPETEVEPEHNETQDDIEIHESFNKLFKKLAMKLHPDKVGDKVTIEQGIENLNMFKEARSALDEKKYFILLDLAERFRLTQSRNYKQQIRWMNRESERLNREIRKEKDTYNYIFAECETDEEKDALIKRFITQLFDIHL